MVAGLALARRYVSEALAIVFPERCAACAQVLANYEELFCGSCQQELVPSASPLCTTCGAAFVGAGPDHLCGVCIEFEPSYTYVRAPYVYAGSAAAAIVAYKYEGRASLAPRLAKLMWQSECFDFASYDQIAPIPLHPKRLRERGYNQSSLLAKEIAKHRNLRVTYDLLRANVFHPPQALANEKDRRSQIRNTFEVSPKYGTDKQRILLVDDVVTTGATSSECARMLKKAGAEQVDVIGFARTRRGER